VGNNVVRSLLADDGAVRVLVRGNADPRPLRGLEVEIAHGDVRDAAAVARAARGATSIIHAAAYVRIGWRGMDTARSVNVEGTRHVASAAAAEGARLVHVSSVDALAIGNGNKPVDEETPPLGGVPCPYVLTKRQAEGVILEAVERGLWAVIVNPGFMLGPYDWKPSSGRMLLDVARGWGLFAPLGTNSYCDVRDVASGIRAALARGRPGRRYILGGQVLSYFQAWRIFAEVTGATPPVFPAIRALRMGAGLVGDVVGRLTGREMDLNTAAAAMSALRRNFSHARAEAELGYRDRGIRAAARDAWHWFCANGYV
jgi:dihydroflavonol-4-reductase